MPALTPVTTPDASTVAIAVLLELQVPPLVASARVMVAPAHTGPAPVMVPALTAGFTVTPVVVVADPHALVKV